MTDPPTEIRQARALLRRLGPLPGSKQRVYLRVTDEPRSTGPVTGRPLLIVAALCVSSTAFGFGASWLSRHPHPLWSAHDAESVPQLAVRVPSSQPKKKPSAPAAAVVTGPAPDVAPDSTTLPNKPVRAAASTEGSSASRIASPVNTAPVPTAAEPEAPESQLSQQVSEYRRAIAQSDPAASLALLRAHRRKWGQSPIAHEVDLRIIEVLGRLGRRSELVQAARQFLLNYPDSARTSDIRRIASATPDDTDEKR